MMSCYGVTAFILAIFMFVCCVISHGMPHWLLSWEQKQNTFERIGLWEVCFTAFSDPKLYAYKFYSGCWWIHHYELDLIRDMLNPAWFKAVQGFAVITALCSLFTVIMMLVVRCSESFKGVGNGAAAALSLITGLSGLICVLIFGACAKDPRLYRLPMPQYNYFGAGFGMMIICTITAGFVFAFQLGHMATPNEEEREKYRQ